MWISGRVVACPAFAVPPCRDSPRTATATWDLDFLAHASLAVAGFPLVNDTNKVHHRHQPRKGDKETSALGPFMHAWEKDRKKTSKRSPDFTGVEVCRETQEEGGRVFVHGSLLRWPSARQAGRHLCGSSILRW